MEFEIENGILKKYEPKSPCAVVPDGVIEIGDRVFSGCDSLKSVILPQSVQKIGVEAFLWCGNLTDATLAKRS